MLTLRPTPLWKGVFMSEANTDGSFKNLPNLAWTLVLAVGLAGGGFGGGIIAGGNNELATQVAELRSDLRLLERDVRQLEKDGANDDQTLTQIRHQVEAIRDGLNLLLIKEGFDQIDANP